MKERKKIPNCTVVFQNDVTVEELVTMFPKGFDGDIVIFGELINSAPNSENTIYGNVYLIGEDTSLDAICGSTGDSLTIMGDLYSGKAIDLCAIDLKIAGDFVCKDEVNGFGSTITVDGDTTIEGGIYNIEKFNVGGDLYVTYDLDVWCINVMGSVKVEEGYVDYTELNVGYEFTGDDFDAQGIKKIGILL